MKEVFAQINYWAVLVAAVVFWLIGMLWFSAVVGKDWSAEIKKHGIKIAKPTTGSMIAKSIWTFVLNFIVAFGIAILVNSLNIHLLGSAIILGLILGICIAAAVMAISYVWEGRSFKLSFYDIFYPFIGILVASIIITLWR